MFITYHIQESESVKEVLQQLPTAQPCVVVRGGFTAIKEAILVVEKDIITTFPPPPPKELPLMLLSAFYAYNMHYPEGCKNLYSFLEVVLLNRKKPSKQTRLSAVIAQLSTC